MMLKHSLSWKQHNYCKLVFILAIKYLYVPSASVCSYNIFSTAWFICDRKHKRLDPERVKMLDFLNKNL
ncbi:hypothetical protein PR048_013546 [Dryococelus australis]|uniref:HAT C-terminal dimerisation domain-containing protein n=1 Tax=Dryococelus australis TaxID=614101 RepID=A0ABQ9HTC2_9NEOP|nr:hypothetical protein PR048_013546 [Dryococelus australis]